jgi:hydrogenase-4 component E
MTTSFAELALFLVVLSDFTVLATSRLSACIRAIAFQGILLGALPLLIHGGLSAHMVVLAIGTAVIKAGVLPTFLRWAIREAAVRREVEPLIGYMASVLLSAAALAIAFAVANVLPLHLAGTDLLVPVALVTVMIGLIVLITRSKAVTQVVGYLMLENGIFLFGLTQSERVPFLVEIGVLLDVFVGVFIMGIVVFHINREFDSISAARLTELHD